MPLSCDALTEWLERSVVREQARSMRAAGHTYAWIADQLGISRSHARYLVDDEYAARTRELSRQSKRRRTGKCVDCGATTRYGGHHGTGVSLRCDACNPSRKKVWTADKVIEAIRTWAAEHDGEPPAAIDWNTTLAARYNRPARDPRFPSSQTVLNACGSWNAAIAAAGFTPRKSGHRRFQRTEDASDWQGDAA